MLSFSTDVPIGLSLKVYNLLIVSVLYFLLNCLKSMQRINLK